jgi:hypothetical protein
LRRVEIFLGPMACSCSGVFDLRDQEKHSRTEMLIASLRERQDEVELRVFDPSEDGAYAEYMKKLRSYLRQAGEGELADRIAFSLKQITPAVAVDGKLECIGSVPSAGEFLDRLSR